jgi:hypothetical protein
MERREIHDNRIYPSASEWQLDKAPGTAAPSLRRASRFGLVYLAGRLGLRLVVAHHSSDATGNLTRLTNAVFVISSSAAHSHQVVALVTAEMLHPLVI